MKKKICVIALATTTGFRLRSYTEQKDVLLTATEVRVS